jgi:serine phosphatase RsbU (regulator of sigma subunit)
MTITWGAFCRPKQGQSVSGDVYVVEQYGEGMVLATVIDGLGGGSEAAYAANLAADIFRRIPDQPLPDLMRRAHVALHSSRGAVVGLLRLDTRNHRASYVGVGNIGIYVYTTQQIKPISKNGIVGARLPTLLELHYTYNSGDTFVLYSDGISSRWSVATGTSPLVSPDQFAAGLVENFGKLSDDATVLVVRA